MHANDPPAPRAPPTAAAHEAPALPAQVLGGTARSLAVLGLDGRALAHLSASDAGAVLESAIAHGLELVLTGDPACELHIGRLEPGQRARLFVAAGTTDRGCERALRGLGRTLARMHADHVDLWQILDLQRDDQLEAVCRRRGALEALVRAREEGLVRFIGLGGDADPALLLEAMRRFDFDTLTLPLRPGERRFAAFREQVLPQARRLGMGLIASPGTVGAGGIVCASYALSYLLSLPADLVVLPCVTPADVALQAHAAAEARRFNRAEMARIDSLLAAG